MPANRDCEYLPSMGISAYCAYITKKFPEFSKTLWFERPGTPRAIKKMNHDSGDFVDDQEGGRGVLYRRAQTNLSVRMVGIQQLLRFAAQNREVRNLSPSYKILDVLGGDGLLAKVVRLLEPRRRSPQPILTSDIAPAMIFQALKAGLPAIRQPAQHLLLKNNFFNAVIFAYGTHHIPKRERLRTFKEAFRVLKLQGVLVVHDFEEYSPSAQWFHTVVNRYSITGHRYPHFTAEEMRSYLKRGGFRNRRVMHIYDPFIVSDSTERGAYKKLMDYILNMYGLEKLKRGRTIAAAREKLYQLILKYICYDYGTIPEAKPFWKNSLSFYRKGSRYIAELPRVALVGIGKK